MLVKRTSRFHVNVVPPEEMLRSIASQGIIVPIECNKFYQILDGERRIACAKILRHQNRTCQVSGHDGCSDTRSTGDEAHVPDFDIPGTVSTTIGLTWKTRSRFDNRQFASKLGKPIPWLLEKLWHTW